MKICILSNLYLETTLPLAKHLAEKGHSVRVYPIIPIYKPNAYTVEYSGQKIKFGFNDSLRLNKMDTKLSDYMGTVEVVPFFHNGNLGKNYLKDIFGTFKIRKRLLAENYDVIHLIGTNSVCLYLHFLLGRKISVQTLHEVTAHEEKTGLLRKILLNKLAKKTNNAIIVHSQTSFDRLINYFTDVLKIKKLPSVKYIPFGLFETNLLYDRKTVLEDENLTLFWGRITQYKGVDVLRRAFKKVVEKLPNAKLLIVGEGKIEPVQADEKNVEIKNKMLNASDIIELNKRAAVVVCPYTSISQSGIPMVTYLFGTPIIASRTGAFVELIENGENGLLVDAGNAEQLADAIIKILSDKNLRQKMRKNIFQQFKDENSKYEWKNIADRTEEVYKNVEINNIQF